MIVVAGRGVRGMGFSLSSLISDVGQVVAAPVSLAATVAGDVARPVLGLAGSILPAAASIAGGTLHAAAASAIPPPPPAPPPSNLPLYLGLGAGLLVLLLVMRRPAAAPVGAPA